jgi:diguanylate cyclase (GGDEF)-like protein
MVVTPEWLLVLLGANLVMGMAIGWIARTFASGSPAQPAQPSPAQPDDPDALLAEISRRASDCAGEMQRYGRELETADGDEQIVLVEHIQKTGVEYEETFTADVARFSDVTLHGDAVLRHVLIELIKHAGHVNRFTKSISEESLPQLDGDVRSVVSAAVADLVRANRKLEGELHSARREIENQRAKLTKVQHEARMDSLTRIANRRYFDERHESLHARFERGSDGYAVAILDLDRFKELNDTYGHAAGDAALRVFARILEDCIRKYDLPARIGGEEFAVLLDSAGRSEATLVAERIRARTASVKVRYRGKVIHFTTSVGVAVAREGEPAESVMHRADAALYAAKNAGRDRVACAWDDECAEPEVAETREMAPVG